ncbi:MAG: oligosaccharide flippase family protein [Pseudomonadota bacterium]
MTALGETVAKSVGSTVFVSTVGRVFTQVLGVATILVATRFVTLEEFGFLALGQAVTIIIGSLLYTGLHQHVMRTKHIAEENATLFTAQCLLGLAGTMLMVAVGLLQPTGSLAQAVFLALAPVSVLQGPTAHYEAFLIREGRIRTAVLTTAAAELLGFVSMCVAIIYGAGVYALIFGRLIASAALLISKAWFAAIWPGLAMRGGVARRAFSSARPLYITTLAHMASTYGGDLLLGFFQSPTAVGAYRAASRVTATLSEVIAKPVITISWSNLARSEREGRIDAMGAAWLDQAKFLTLAAWPALAALSLLSAPVVDFILDESWGEAAPVIGVLAIAIAVGILDGLSGPALLCTQKDALFTRLTFVWAGIAVGSLLVTAQFGPIAVAYGLLVARLIMMPITLSFVLRALNIPLSAFARALAPSVIVTLACCLAVASLQSATDYDLRGLLITAGAGAALWITIFLALLTLRVVQLPRP